MAISNDQEPTFDPRSWIARTPPAPAVPTPVAVRPVPRRRGDAIATGAGIAIALAGTIAAWMARPPATAAPPAARAHAAIDNRTLIVPTLAEVAPALLASGVSPPETAAAVQAVGRAIDTAPGEIRLAFTLAHEDDAVRLAALAATRADGSGVTLARRAAGGFAATAVAAGVHRTTRFVRGELDGQSFYSSAVAAGVSDVLIGPFVNAFRYDFDMQREVAAGDVFEAGFEQPVNADGEPVGAPVLVYASLATASKSRALYRYRAPGDAEAEWFDSGGKSSRRSLMRTPVEAARISSGFGMRGHPILGFVKMHKGTDFAAPTGTPIYAAGDATVTFAGPKGPNGNFVRLHHPNGWDTLYLHMNRIAAGLVPGLHVAQGQQIGEVGTTGRSTGPHLHYEVHVDGQPVDPMSIAVGGGRSLAGDVLARFRALRDRVDATRVAGAGER